WSGKSEATRVYCEEARQRLVSSGRGGRTMNRWLAVVAVVALSMGAARAQDDDPAESAVWKKVHASVFANAVIAPADGIVTLDTPKRAEDAAIVPVAI